MSVSPTIPITHRQHAERRKRLWGSQYTARQPIVLALPPPPPPPPIDMRKLIARASEIAASIPPGKPGRILVSEIIEAAAEHFGVSFLDVVSERRTKNVMRPRQIAMYLARKLTPRSTPQIGQAFGGRDHTTIMHAINKIEAQLEVDEMLKDQVERVGALIYERHKP